VNHFKTITAYCEAIAIAPPQHAHFDIRSFRDNMATVVHNMPPFRHECYAIALKLSGGGTVVSGHYTDFPKGSTIFFNSPFQILSWDIVPNWEGFYIMFSQDFIAQSHFLKDLLGHFPFLKIERDMPFEVGVVDAKTILSIYEAIQTEYHSAKPDRFLIIESYVLLLLNYIKRYFHQTVTTADASAEIRKTDLKLLSRFRTLLETGFYPDHMVERTTKPHATSYYAQKLHIHPNHLNAVVKQLTGQTAKQHIQNHIAGLAKSMLGQTQDSVKEIAYALHFDSPSAFSSFFKKMTATTPNAYRKNHIL